MLNHLREDAGDDIVTLSTVCSLSRVILTVELKSMPKSSPRKRAPRMSKESRENLILAAARDVFEEVGYDDAKMADIAKRIDVVEGTVFHHFGSKKLLMVKVIEQFYQMITSEVRQGLLGIQGTRNRLFYLIRFHLQTVINDARLCSVILSESRGLDDEIADNIHVLNREYTKPLLDVLREGIDSGEIKPGISTSLIRNTIYGSIEHRLWSMLADQTGVDVDDEAKQLTDLVYGGIRSETTIEGSDIALLVRKLNQLLD